MAATDTSVAEKLSQAPAGQVRTSPDKPGPAVAPWDVIIKVLAAITTGIGVLGFVTLAGGVVLFERLQGAGLPAEDAVAVVPRAELLTVGASQLVPLACLVGAIVLVLWLILGDEKARSARDGGVKARVRYTLQALRVPLVAAGATAVGVGYFAVTAYHFPSVFDIVLLLVVLAGGAALGLLVWARLRRMKARLGWFAILIAVMIPVEGALIGWVQARESPLVKPTVLYDSSTHTLVEGFFIADTADRVYIAEVDQLDNRYLGKRATGRMLAFPHKDVTRLSVGANQPMGQARTRWPELVHELESTLPASTAVHVVY